MRQSVSRRSARLALRARTDGVPSVKNSRSKWRPEQIRVRETSSRMARSLGVNWAAIWSSRPPEVREKTHRSRPMTLDQALYEMELVGHDFYLYVDHDTRRPAVVYRRRGYDYGVISLDLNGTA